MNCGKENGWAIRPEGRVAALLAAAGCSSRMGDWKPQMKIGGIPLIIRELTTFFESGVSDCWIVTGYRDGDLREMVQTYLPEKTERIHFLLNAAYAESQMFDSIRLGLSAIREQAAMDPEEIPGAVFITASDIPLFSEYSLKQCLGVAEQHPGNIRVPCWKGRRGHPLLLRTCAVESVLHHDGKDGMKGVLEKLADEIVRVPVPDRGVVMDADTPEEFEELQKEFLLREEPDENRCRDLLEWMNVPEQILRNGRAVAELAEEIAAATGLSEQACRQVKAAGWLHDIAGGRQRHAEAGAQLLRSLGYHRTADIVELHRDLPESHIAVWDEAAVLFLADKLVQGDRRVSPEEGFETCREGCLQNRQENAQWRRRLQCMKLAYGEALRRGFSRPVE